jgi:hypothetical protein
MYSWAVFVILGIGFIGFRTLRTMVPELDLPEGEAGRIADVFASWILVGVGLILREVRKKE